MWVTFARQRVNSCLIKRDNLLRYNYQLRFQLTYLTLTYLT